MYCLYIAVQTKIDIEFKEIIARRHIVRKFTDQPVERGIIDEMIAEAMMAPSSKNTRSTGFMIVEDKSILEILDAYTAEFSQRPGSSGRTSAEFRHPHLRGIHCAV